MKYLKKAFLSCSFILLLAYTAHALAEPPARVEGFRAETVTYGQIGLAWDMAPGADGYEIYRADGINAEFSLIAGPDSAAQTQYADVSLVYGVTYRYKIRAFVMDYEISAQEEGQEAPPEITPVKVYGEFSETVSAAAVLADTVITEALSASSTSIRLQWELVGAHKYIVFRSDTQTGAYRTLGETNQNTASFIDHTAVLGKIYYYRVLPCVTLNGRTHYSSSVPARGQALLEKTKISSVRLKTPTTVEIRWNTNPKAEGYVLCRAVGETGKFKKLKTLPGKKTASCLVSKQKNGTHYRYKVYAYITIGGVPLLGSEPAVKSRVMDWYGYSGEPYAAKQKRIFGNTSQSRYASNAKALKRMKWVRVKVWDFDKRGKKVTRIRGFYVHKKIAGTVVKIFNEIYRGKEKFPMHTVWGYNWRGAGSSSEHCLGTAIDINSRENYMIRNNGQVVAGNFYRPRKNAYSIPPNGDVVRAFKKYGFRWGGEWVSSKDYMHFSYFGR